MTDQRSDSSMDDSLDMFKRKTRMARWKEYMSEEANKEWADLILIVTCFISGLVDSAVFNVWSCFVSMQTGKYSTHNTRQMELFASRSKPKI